MILSFRLSMPNVGSWNGQWSGKGKLFVIIRNVGRPKRALENSSRILVKGHYRFSWRDGWSAGVTVEEVTAGEGRKIKNKSEGFCGYDWMVDSIIEHGKIRAPDKTYA